MAARFKSTDLKEMIRSIVREEMADVVRRTISEVLSERYLSKLAESVASQRPAPQKSRLERQIEEADVDDIREPRERVPEPLANSDRGAYARHPIKKESRNPHLPPEIADSPFATFYEGTVPLPREKEPFEGVPLPAGTRMEYEDVIPEPRDPGEDMGFAPLPDREPTPRARPSAMAEQAERYKQILAGVQAATPTAMQLPPSVVEARLKQKREALEIPVHVMHAP